MEPETSDLVLDLVSHGFGIGFVPEQAAEQALRRGDVFALNIAEDIPPRSISLLEYEGHTLSLAARRRPRPCSPKTPPSPPPAPTRKGRKGMRGK